MRYSDPIRILLRSILKERTRKVLRETRFYPRPANLVRWNHFWNIFYSFVIKILDRSRDNGAKILDAGCGRGHYLKKICAEIPNIYGYGYNLEIKKALKTKKKLKKHHSVIFKEKDLRNLTKEKYFDFVYCIDVLEHIPKNKEIIKKFHTALRENGLLLIHMPTVRR